jgi:hypothetical protein
MYNGFAVDTEPRSGWTLGRPARISRPVSRKDGYPAHRKGSVNVEVIRYAMLMMEAEENGEQSIVMLVR